MPQGASPPPFTWLSPPLPCRLLRASLLQPLTDIPTLELRYDCLQEILDNETMSTDVALVSHMTLYNSCKPVLIVIPGSALIGQASCVP